MNYRHAFHAGSPADVVKHAVLARILVHLRNKPAAFRVIDTHAGAGLYDLRGPEASRSPEWRDGIHRLMSAPIEAEARALLAPYLDVVAGLNPRATSLPSIPVRRRSRARSCAARTGWSPAKSSRMQRPRSPAISVATAASRPIAIDGWMALNAYVPPPERRGVVLIDPPFEAADDFARLAQALEGAHRKWATGIFLLWYPIKGRQDPDALARRLQRSAIPKVLRAEVDFDAVAGAGTAWRLRPDRGQSALDAGR